MFEVIKEDGYIKVKRPSDNRIIAAAPDNGTMILKDMEYLEPEYRKAQSTRQAVYKALKAAGYR